MEKLKLGNSNLEVAAIGFGCVGMSFGYGSAKDASWRKHNIDIALQSGSPS